MVALKNPAWTDAVYEFSAWEFATSKQEIIEKHKKYDLKFIGEPEPVELCGHAGFWFRFEGREK